MTLIRNLGVAAASAAALAGCASGGHVGSLATRSPDTPTVPAGEPDGGSNGGSTGGQTGGDETGGQTGGGDATTGGGQLVPLSVISSVPPGVGVSRDPDTGTLVVSLRGQDLSFTPGAATLELAPGVTAQAVTPPAGFAGDLVSFAFGDKAGRSRLLLFKGPPETVQTGFGNGLGAVTWRLNAADVPDIPTTGSATYDTKLAGEFSYNGLLNDTDRELVVSRGTVQADFGARTITADFPDLDFVVDGVPLETTRLGHDFGVQLFGGRIADDGSFTLTDGFSESRRGPGAFGVDLGMEGEGSGQFLGDAGGSPTGVAGTLLFGGEEGPIFADLVAGFEGLCGCTAPTPDIPTMGVASFDTGVTGLLTYRSLENVRFDDLMTGRGTIAVDFGAGTLSGQIDDVDFVRGGVISETTLLQNDFGLSLHDGTVTGDQVSFIVDSFPNSSDDGPGVIDMTGVAQGAISAAPGRLEIGAKGAITNFSADPVINGTVAFEGVAPAP